MHLISHRSRRLRYRTAFKKKDIRSHRRGPSGILLRDDAKYVINTNEFMGRRANMDTKLNRNHAGTVHLNPSGKRSGHPESLSARIKYYNGSNSSHRESGHHDGCQQRSRQNFKRETVIFNPSLSLCPRPVTVPTISPHIHISNHRCTEIELQAPASQSQRLRCEGCWARIRPDITFPRRCWNEKAPVG